MFNNWISYNKSTTNNSIFSFIESINHYINNLEIINNNWRPSNHSCMKRVNPVCINIDSNNIIYNGIKILSYIFISQVMNMEAMHFFQGLMTIMKILSFLSYLIFVVKLGLIWNLEELCTPALEYFIAEDF